MAWQAEGASERAERRERSRGPTKIRWSAPSRAETEENVKQTMPPSVCVCVSGSFGGCPYLQLLWDQMFLLQDRPAPFCAPCRSGRALKTTNM